jgi:hypothetical protein
MMKTIKSRIKRKSRNRSRRVHDKPADGLPGASSLTLNRARAKGRAPT